MREQKTKKEKKSLHPRLILLRKRKQKNKKKENRRDTHTDIEREREKRIHLCVSICICDREEEEEEEGREPGTKIAHILSSIVVFNFHTCFLLYLSLSIAFLIQ